MSVSRRTGDVYYTDEEKEKALQNTNALKYALSHGYQLMKSGNEYRLKEHDSMVFELNGKWHWNSRGLHGDALDLLQHYGGYTYQEAICELAGTLNDPQHSRPVTDVTLPEPTEKKEFVLPERADNFKIIFAYLIKERGIDEGLVKHLVVEQKLYQSKAYNNVVMIGFDDHNTARYASLRSTNSYKKIFKIDVSGSDKSYPFVIEGKAGSDTVCVFESPIEVMSYWSLCKETQSSRIHDNLLSLGGAGVLQGLDRFLSDHPNIKNIVSGLNNDSELFGHEINAGRNGTQKIIDNYGERYNVITHRPHLNDWNDVLKNYRQNLQPKMQDLTRSAEKVTQITKPLKSMEMAI